LTVKHIERGQATLPYLHFAHLSGFNEASELIFARCAVQLALDVRNEPCVPLEPQPRFCFH